MADTDGGQGAPPSSESTLLEQASKDIEETFKKYDVDGSGSIDNPELAVALRELGVELETAEAAKVLHAYDKSKTGGLEFVEFRALVGELRACEVAAGRPALKRQPDAYRQLVADAPAATPEAAPAAPVDELEQAFRKYDNDNSGCIDTKEFMAILREVGVEVEDALALKVLQGYDKDRSGTLEMEEFRKVVTELRAYQAANAPAAPPAATAPAVDDDISEVFRKFDRNKSGDIDTKELKEALFELGLEGDSAETARVLQGFDKDSSGSLQAAEFRQLVLTLRAFKKNKTKPRFKAVAAKSYLPRFKANKPDDGKTGSFLAFLEKEEAEKRKAEERRLALERKRKSKGKKGKQGQTAQQQSDEAWGSMVFMVLLTVLISLSEAFDLDVLIGFAMMPFISTMKWFAAKFDNQNLDPTVWAAWAGHAASTFMQTHQLGFVVVDFGLFAYFVVFFLFQADIDKWFAQRALREQGYNQVEDDSPGGFLAKVATDPEEVQALLTKAREELEGVNLMIRLRGKEADPEVVNELNGRRSKFEKQIATYNNFLAALKTQAAEAVDLEELARQEAEEEAKRAREGGCAETTKLGVKILKNAISGIITMWLYFMDLISDYQVTMLFYRAGAFRFAFVSACLLVGQFAVVWWRVLPYLYDTYGPSSAFYLSFLYSFPFGMFFLDFLMFLGPFGLLPITPMPESLRQFVPAYAATRIIGEVLIEALPQCIMQAVILVMVSSHVRAGTASQTELNLMAVNDGSFVNVLPKSIGISTLTMLKTWYELVQEAREAGIPVAKKAVQLWNVGYGLPLDAIKSGSLIKWKCQYEISDNEVVSLVDALGKNDSLENLDLSLAGLEWMPPIEREERSALSGLLTVMQADRKALEALENLIICPNTLWPLPILKLRSGPQTALKSLTAAPFLSKGGPGRKEVHAMYELLCKNRNPEPSDGEIDASYNAVAKIFNEARAEVNSASKRAAKRGNWQTGVAQLISKGMVRRAHFRVLLSAEILRNVGFGVQELLDLAFSAVELKAGGFTAKELKQAGFKAVQLRDLNYKPREMWEAEITAAEMKSLGFQAKDLKEGGYTALQMKDSRAFTLVELKDGKYKAAELGEAGYRIPDIRDAKFTALDLRKALIFQVGMMHDAGYTVHEMKGAGYDCQRIYDAGYDAQEATDAGYTLAQMFAASYKALDLRKAGHTALVLREVGYDLNALQGAGYSAEDLQNAGYSAQELKEAGTSLVQLKAAGTPIAVLKDSGYTAQRLKQQGYTAAELAFGARGRVDVKTLLVGGDDGGYTAKELKGGGITATELRRGKVFFRIEEWKDGGWTVRELKDGGYLADELRACGYLADALFKVGYSVLDLVVAGYSVATLRAIGAPAGELRQAGLNAKQLAEVGYSAKELLVGGFTAKDLIACGFGVGALREAGFDAIQLRALGFSAKELKAYGYGAKALKDAGSVVKELKELGFPDVELEEAGFTKRAVEAVDGRSVAMLKMYGKYEVAELKEYGFVVADLRGIYSVKNLKNQGFSLDEIRMGGVPHHAVQAVDGRSTAKLRRAGYTAKVLRKIGFTLSELLEGSYSASDLKDAAYTPSELKEVGFDAGALRVAGFTSRQLMAAQYKLRELQEGGFDWRDLVIFLRVTHAELTAAGCKGLDPLHRLFLEYRPESDEEQQQMIHDLSILSPRRRMGHPDIITKLSPRAPESKTTTTRGFDPLRPRVGGTALVLREGPELNSANLGDVQPGTCVEVLETKWMQLPGEEGRERARVRFASWGMLAGINSSWLATSWLKEGWVTSISPNGTHQLIIPDGYGMVAPSRLPPPSGYKALNEFEA